MQISPPPVPSLIPSILPGLKNSVTTFGGQIFSQGIFEFIADIGIISFLAPYIVIAKTISLILSVVFGFFFTLILMKIRDLRNLTPSLAASISPPKSVSGGALGARWTEINKHLDSAKETDWKLAVLEADKLMDLALMRAGFEGETLGEKLMAIQPGQMVSLQDMWEAHKVRNRVAHEIDYFLRYTEAKRAADCYERALKELGAI